MASSQANKEPLVTIHEEIDDYTYGDLFRVVRTKLQYRRFDGSLSDEVTRLNFARGMAVGVLLHNAERDTVVLVRQFRYPVYASLDEPARSSDPERAWMLEIVAGVPEDGKSAEDIARKELDEEAGISVDGELEQIATIYPSPGGSSEQVTIFLGHISGQQRGEGGGVVSEGEDTQVVELPFTQALSMIGSGAITDAKTVIALQHLALRQARQSS